MPAVELLPYWGHSILSSGHMVLGLPVKTKDMRYFCIMTATVALTEVEPPPGPPAPPEGGPPALEEAVAEAAAEVAVEFEAVELDVVVPVLEVESERE